jgi:hypothetical protein
MTPQRRTQTSRPGLPGFIAPSASRRTDGSDLDTRRYPSSRMRWSGVVEKVLLPMVISPAVGLVLGYLVMTGML